MTFDNILVPVDGSEASLSAARHARALAESFGGRVTLAHVVPNAAYLVGDAIIVPPLLLNELDENGKIVMDKARAVFEGFAGELATELLHGDPGAAIADLAKERNCTLVIMGRRGLGGLAGLLLGSVSNYILHNTACPTLIVKETGAAGA
ncbi:universal stress protein [Desulfovibrio aminophilus]|nr:universal stress protein [Desulfovibrio aminophilus]MCM0755665.1 universal stress protein [Desulfovibrio aminophilus]